MKMLIAAAIALPIGCSSLEAPAAAEEVVRETIRGTIGPYSHDTAWDQLGIFGAASADIEGSRFVLSFVVDYNQPISFAYKASDVALTINGRSWTFPGATQFEGNASSVGFDDLYTPTAFSQFSIGVLFDTTGLTGWNDVFNREFNVTDGYGRFRYYEYARADDTDFLLAPTSIAFEKAESVPEAATWVMMIVGMGSAGSLLRRGHRVAQPARAISA